MVEATPRNPGSTRVGGSVCPVKRRQPKRGFAYRTVSSRQMATCSRGPLSSAAQNSARRLSNTLLQCRKTLEPNVILHAYPEKNRRGFHARRCILAARRTTTLADRQRLLRPKSQGKPALASGGSGAPARRAADHSVEGRQRSRGNGAIAPGAPLVDCGVKGWRNQIPCLQLSATADKPQTDHAEPSWRT
jgi:hypothetical protein